MPVIRCEDMGLWEFGMMLDTLKPYLRDFEAFGLAGRLVGEPVGLWLAKAWKLRQAFPDHWIHGLGVGFRRVKFLTPGLLNSIDFRMTFANMRVLRSMAEKYLGLRGVGGRGSKNSRPPIHDYKALRKALLEAFLMLLEERVGRVDYAWREV
jgi:hypothetical protein